MSGAWGPLGPLRPVRVLRGGGRESGAVGPRAPFFHSFSERGGGPTPALSPPCAPCQGPCGGGGPPCLGAGHPPARLPICSSLMLTRARLGAAPRAHTVRGRAGRPVSAGALVFQQVAAGPGRSRPSSLPAPHPGSLRDPPEPGSDHGRDGGSSGR